MSATANSGKPKRTIYFSFFFLALVCFGFMAAEMINDRFWLSDFEVYYKAAQRISAAENLYQHAEDGHYIFKYSPTSALFFIPFIVFSFAVAKCLYWSLLTVVILAGFYLCIKNIRPSAFERRNKKVVNRTVLIATVMLAVHFLRELHLGQVNYLLLFVYILAMHSLVNNRWILASVLLGVSIFIKPFALIFLPYFLIKKKYREISVFALSALVFALLPLLFYGSIDMATGQYRLWFTELQVELSHKQSLLADANHTIFSVLARYTPLRFIITPGTVSSVYQICVLLLIAILVYYFVKILPRKNDNPSEKNLLVTDFALLISLIPLLAFTSENAFVYAQVLVFVILLYFHRLKTFEKILAILGFLFIGGNFSELTGKELSIALDNISLISIGTIILICLLFVLRKRGLEKEMEETGQ